MRPDPFTYHQPKSLAEASSLVAELGDGATFYAGGTELLLLMKMQLAEYRHLVNLKKIDGLKTIGVEHDRLVIGALATHCDIALSTAVSKHCPSLSRLCSEIANIRVRVAGTIGGNLCFAEPRADPPVLLVALDAGLQLVSAHASRVIPASEFFLGPFETARKPDEILTTIEIPLGTGAASFERMKQGNYSLATAAISRSDCHQTWIGYGGGPPKRLNGTGALLDRDDGRTSEEALFAAVAEDIFDLEIPSDLEAGESYRRHLIAVAVKRALASLHETEPTGVH
ncbi:FAD binding domain-containing protein [Hoeflea sp. CAU 1731]